MRLLGCVSFVGVFPASAGVFPEDAEDATVTEGIPRIRGGVSR